MRLGGLSCIIADFKLPGIDGIEFLRRVREHSHSVPFLLMTAFGSIDIAVEAMKIGANDFLCKPFEPQTLCDVIKDLMQHKRIVERTTSLRNRRDRMFLTSHASGEKILHQAKKVAAVDSSVLILGESGTGKELLARYIHEHSSRRDKLFVAVNCAAMPADLLESEFFGHEAGAFTGATQSRPGVFEVASEGTIFLDEIGEMPLNLQVKLLRALQEKEIKRLGGCKLIKVDPRIISATNHNIEEALAKHTLRDDLYYRIAVFSFTIPPLRERSCDIDLLTKYFLDYFSSQLGRSVLLSPTAKELLHRYAWPGNARELENVIERAVILAEGEILPEHLGLQLDLDFESLSEASATLSEIAGRAVRRAETDTIRKALERTMGNKSRAASMLGVSYKTLLSKVRDYEI